MKVPAMISGTHHLDPGDSVLISVNSLTPKALRMTNITIRQSATPAPGNDNRSDSAVSNSQGA